MTGVISLVIIKSGFADTTISRRGAAIKKSAANRINKERKIKATKMKKGFLSLLSAILLILLALSCLGACSRIKKKKTTPSSTEVGTLSSTEHLETESDSEEESEKESSTQSESPSEQEKPTEVPTEKPTESESESETETEPAPSLEYLSLGNGTCKVTGIGSCTDVYIIIPEKSPQGDVVVSIGEKAFFENSSIKAVQIPSTVMSIEKMAFGGCSSLVYVHVDPNNMIYTDKEGVLYSKDKTRLILYPPACLANEIFISQSVTEIADMAFFSTPNLKFIKYGGALSDWSKIKIGDKNYGIYQASLTFAVTE